jgi:catechol 2,3-dioxygenase-like lactoylglutathione lyase family enzyme
LSRRNSRWRRHAAALLPPVIVSDWKRSNSFYRDVVGAELVDRGGGTWAYRFGAEQLNVHGPGATPGPVARIPVAPGNSDLCFEWSGSIEGATAHLHEHGVEVEQGPVAQNGSMSCLASSPSAVAAGFAHVRQHRVKQLLGDR